MYSKSNTKNISFNNLLKEFIAETNVFNFRCNLITFRSNINYLMKPIKTKSSKYMDGKCDIPSKYINIIEKFRKEYVNKIIVKKEDDKTELGYITNISYTINNKIYIYFKVITKNNISNELVTTSWLYDSLKLSCPLDENAQLKLFFKFLETECKDVIF